MPIQTPTSSVLSGHDYQAFRVERSAPVDGATLAKLNLPFKTGATVVAVCRGETTLPLQTRYERLQDGDLVALSGSQ
ncbi:MAG: cation:proton antiporter regulatory subunit [Planctomycetota bacterium]